MSPFAIFILKMIFWLVQNGALLLQTDKMFCLINPLNNVVQKILIWMCSIISEKAESRG